MNHSEKVRTSRRRAGMIPMAPPTTVPALAHTSQFGALHVKFWFRQTSCLPAARHDRRRDSEMSMQRVSYSKIPLIGKNLWVGRTGLRLRGYDYDDCCHCFSCSSSSSSYSSCRRCCYSCYCCYCYGYDYDYHYDDYGHDREKEHSHYQTESKSLRVQGFWAL